MFSLSKLVLGQAVSVVTLDTLINNQSFTRFGNQIVGNLLQWSNNEEVTCISHMNAAPNGTTVYAREHYVSDVTFVKNNDQWYVSNIQSR